MDRRYIMEYVKGFNEAFRELVSARDDEEFSRGFDKAYNHYYIVHGACGRQCGAGDDVVTKAMRWLVDTLRNYVDNARGRCEGVECDDVRRIEVMINDIEGFLNSGDVEHALRSLAWHVTFMFDVDKLSHPGPKAVLKHVITEFFKELAISLARAPRTYIAFVTN